MPHRETNRCRAPALLAIAAAALCHGCDSKPEPPPDPKAAFRGATIGVLIPESDGLRAWIEDLHGEWSAQTGAHVRVETYSDRDPTRPERGLAGSAIATPKRPEFDLLVFPASSMANAVAAGLAAKFTKPSLESPSFELKDIAPAVADHLIAWDRQVVAFPVSAECLLVYYRTDVFQSPELRMRFESQHGRALEPPQSWDEFDRLVRFFDGMDHDGDGTADRGLSIASAGDAVIARAAAYGKAPQNYSFFFDVNTFEPLLAAPAFRLAFEDWRTLAPSIAVPQPDAAPLADFHAGKTPLAIGSSLVALEMTQSHSNAAESRRGDVAFAALPGHSRVYLHDNQSWTDLPAGQLNRVSVVRGWCATVPSNCPQPAAARDFAEFITSRERSLLYVTTPRFKLGPFRLSHLVDPAAWIAGGWPAPAAPSLVAAQRFSLNHGNVVAGLRIDDARQFESALDEHAHQAIFGEKELDTLIDSLTTSWRQRIEAGGHDRLRRQYRYSLGIPVLN